MRFSATPRSLLPPSSFPISKSGERTLLLLNVLEMPGPTVEAAQEGLAALLAGTNGDFPSTRGAEGTCGPTGSDRLAPPSLQIFLRMDALPPSNILKSPDHRPTPWLSKAANR